MTASCPSAADRLLKGKGEVQSWACQEEPGREAAFPRHQLLGLSWELANLVRLLLGLVPPPTFHSLCGLNPKVRNLAQGGKKSEQSTNERPLREGWCLSL